MKHLIDKLEAGDPIEEDLTQDMYHTLYDAIMTVAFGKSFARRLSGEQVTEAEAAIDSLLGRREFSDMVRRLNGIA